MLTGLVEDAKIIQQYIKQKSVKNLPAQELKTEVMRILVTYVMLELKKLFRLQDRMLKSMKRGLNITKH